MFDFSVITGNAHLIGQGLLITLYYTIITVAAGLVLGLLVGLIQLSALPPLVWLGRIFVEFFRNIPLLVLLLWTYYALPIFAGINMTKGWAGFLALSCYAAAFYAEILRAGVQSIDPGQTDAATALGMSYGKRMRRIILPQAFRRMVPPLAGQSIIQMKNTTLLSTDDRPRSSLPGKLHREFHLPSDGESTRRSAPSFCCFSCPSPCSPASWSVAAEELRRMTSVDPHVLSLSGIRLRFGEREVLKGVDLNVQRSEVVVLIGASGSGKTSLLRCINLLNTPSSGRIVIDGETIFDVPEGSTKPNSVKPAEVNRIRANTGMVFQQFNLFPHMTILENVMEGPFRSPAVRSPKPRRREGASWPR